MKNKIILIVLLFAFSFVSAQVPNTSTFNLQNVVDEINPTTDDLADCISDADADLYDPDYYTAPATSLLEFRNYGYGGGNGFLYNGNIMKTSNPFPTDWDIPTTTQTNTLITYLGGFGVAGGKIKETGYEKWDSPNTGATNSYDFSFYGSGYRNYITTQDFIFFKLFSYMWTKSAYSTSEYYSCQASYNSDDFDDNHVLEYRFGASIRLIYNGSGTPPPAIEDYDGNIYGVIQIGTQYWLDQNWKCATNRIGTSFTKVESETTWKAASNGGTPYYCAYDNNMRNVYNTNIIKYGIISTPDNYSFLYNERIDKTCDITILPDATFTIVQAGDYNEFIITNDQSANTITVCPASNNESGFQYTMTLTVSSSGYDSEVITIIQYTNI